MASGRTISNVGLRLSSYVWRRIRPASALALLVAMAVAPAAAAPLKATLAVAMSDGYARLVFSSDEYIDATTKVAGHVLIITFKQPIDVSVDRVPELASDYVGAARRDPDGTAIRMALSQEVTVNAMGAGEKLFIDLLPSSWTGPPPLEVIANLDGREVTRLRADILWSAKRWDESAEQIELLYGDRYKDFATLSDVEQQDILRAEIGYALSSDALGLARFREKYAAKMAQTPDAKVFEVVSAPLGSSGEQFAVIAKAATSIDTLDGFLRDMKARYPESSAASSAMSAPAVAAPMVSAVPGGAPPQASSQPPAAPIAPPTKPRGSSAQNMKVPSAKKIKSARAPSARTFNTAALDNRAP
jgi:hypothetical protein